MANYAFTVPILPGKTETWKRYIHEMMGQHREEYNRSRQRVGLRTEEAWLQKTPEGDIVVVSWECDNPNRIFDNFMKSDDQFDKWFRDKILIECHGMTPDKGTPPINELVLDFHLAKTTEKAYTEPRKK